MKLIIRWFISTLAVGIAVAIVPGIYVVDSRGWWAVAVMAITLGLVNAILRPILAFLSCGCIVLSLGLFMVVVNGFAFWAGSWVALNWFNVGFYVDGLWPAILGSIVVSIASFFLSMLLPDH